MRSLARATAAFLFCAVTWLTLRQQSRSMPAPAEPSMAVWVFFHLDSARTSLPPALSRYTLQSRAARGLSVFENDRPLPPRLIDLVRAAGAEVRHESRWLRAVSVNADGATLDRLRALPMVHALRPVGRVQRAGHWSAGMTVAIANAQVSTACAPSLPSDSTLYGDNWPAIRVLGIPAVRASGFTGSRVRVAILDTGFDPRHESLASRSIAGARDFIHGDETVYDQPGDLGTMAARHGTQVFSILGGCSPGIVVGPAYAADFLLAKVDVEPGDSVADEDRWIAGAEWADSLGADVIASPVTFRYDFIDRAPYSYNEMNGDSTRTTRIADEAARRGILVVAAIGDNGAGGTGTLSAPADGDSVLAVGAVNSAGEPAAFTSRGPSSDDRTKPEVVARGVGLTGASSLSPQSYDRNSLDGTSYSTALIAGAVAMFRQAWPALTPAAVRQAFLLSGDRATAPDNALGFGVPDVAGAILFPAGLLPDRIEDLDTNGNLTILAPVFSWITRQVHPQLSPVRYTLQIARDSLFNNIVYSDTVREANSLRTRVAIKPATGLRWRVVASTINLQVPVRRVSPAGVTFNAPSWVRLISPDPTQVTETNERPEFVWQPLIAPAPIGPLRYDVEILSNQTGNPVQTIRNLTTASVRLQSPLVPNTAYRWRVIVRTQLNEADTVTSTREFIVDSDSAPPSTLLYQNFPNPFPRPDLGQTVTNIWFDLERASEVELSVFDLGGRLIRHLIPAHPSCGRITLQSGVYGRGPQDPTDQCRRTFWDGTDSAGRQVEPGVYLLRLRANGRDFYRRMLYLPQF